MGSWVSEESQCQWPDDFHAGLLHKVAEWKISMEFSFNLAASTWPFCCNILADVHKNLLGSGIPHFIECIRAHCIDRFEHTVHQVSFSSKLSSCRVC
jgi:hypothetical protein